MTAAPASGAATGAAQLTDALARVERLAPLLDATGPYGDRARRLSPELVEGLHAEKLYRLALPRWLGGLELPPPVFLQAIEQVAKHDASAAWCLCQAAGCATTAAYVERAVAEAIWGPRDAVLAWGPGKAEAVMEGEGYRMSGRWSFASGGRHATWLGGHSTVIGPDRRPRRLADGSPEIRTLLFPADRAEMTDIWDVVGLRGTGSDAYAADGVFVRHDHSVARDEPAERRDPAPLYRFPAMSLFAFGFAGVALGIARAVLDGFLALALDKTPRLGLGRLKDSQLVQAEVGQCEAQIGAARAYLLTTADDVWREALASGAELTLPQRVRIRLAATHAIHQAKGAVDTLYDAAGASAIFAAGPFERRFRDLHTVTQQLQGRKAHYRTVGAWMLGHPPEPGVL